MPVNGQPAIRPMMYVALSYDHRIVDGREAVQFLVKVKDYIEDPATCCSRDKLIVVVCACCSRSRSSRFWPRAPLAPEPSSRTRRRRTWPRRPTMPPRARLA